MCGKLWLILVVSVLVLTVSGTYAQNDFNIQPVVQYNGNWHDAVTDVAISNGYALLACGNDGLRIVSGYDTDSPTIVGTFPNGSWQVVATGHYAYMNAPYPESGISIIDFSNPAQPVEAGQIADVSGHLRIIGSHLFVCGSSGFTMVDISNPAQPQMIWQWSTGEYGAEDIDIVGNRAYVAARDLWVFDVADLTSPQLLYTIPVSDPVEEAVAEGVRAAGNYAFVACGLHGFQVVDIAARQIVAQIDSLSYAYQIELRDSYAYLYYGPFSCPLAIIDVSNPPSPQVTGIYRPPMFLGGFALEGNRAYVADMYYGFRTVDISNPANPFEISRYNHYGDYKDIQVIGDRAYVGTGVGNAGGWTYRIQVLNISDRQHPAEMGDLEIPGGYDLQNVYFAAAGNTCFVARELYGESILAAFDMTDPASPALLESLPGADANFGLYLHGQYAYLAGQEILKVYNVSNPAAMTLAGSYSHPDRANNLAFHDQYVFMADGYRIEVLDLSDPASPVAVDTITTPRGYVGRVAVSNGLLIALCHDSFYVYDAVPTGPHVPRSVTAFPEGRTSGWGRVSVQDHHVIIRMDSSYMLVYDVTNPDAPMLSGCYQTPGQLYGVDAVGNEIFVADGRNIGMYDFTGTLIGGAQTTMTLPRDVALRPNYPNPFNLTTQIPFDLPSQGLVTLAIYDILGRTVATLASGNYLAGSHIISWQGTSTSGQPVASGQYFVRLQTAGKVQTRPITLLK